MTWEIICWLAAVVLFAALEAATVNLVALWFVGGSVCALLAAICGGPLWLQIVLFFVVSGALLGCLRPFVQKYVNPKRVATNADRNIGQTAVVTEQIDNVLGTGAVKISGTEWSARSLNGCVIEKDTLVTVREIEGVKLYVEPAEAAACTK